jgi:hypothetical protein
MSITTEIVERNTLQAAQAIAPAKIAAEMVLQASATLPAELIASEISEARKLRKLQADIEQASLDALCIVARQSPSAAELSPSAAELSPSAAELSPSA